MTLRLIVTLLLLTLSAVAQPKRIVSTSPSITETLFALGLGPHVVGVSEYCQFPEEVKQLPKVGTFLRPNSEQIARLQPDLVIIHKLPNDLANRMSSLGIRSLEVERDSLQSLHSMIEKIGDATGTGSRARELNATIHTQLDDLQKQAATLPKPKVLFVVGRRLGTLQNLVVTGSASYLNDLIKISGARNVMDDPSMPTYPRISLETVVRLDPDVLIDVADPMTGAIQPTRRQDEVAALWSQQQELVAVRFKRVYGLNSEAFVVPGPRVAEVARTLFSIFHPQGSK